MQSCSRLPRKRNIGDFEDNFGWIIRKKAELFSSDKGYEVRSSLGPQGGSPGGKRSHGI